MRSTLFFLLLLSTIPLMSGCECETYSCDSLGCFYCDDLGCREVEPEERVVCSGDFQCTEGEVCSDLGCLAGCTADTECATGTVCRAGFCVGPTEPDPKITPGICSSDEQCFGDGVVCLDNGQCGIAQSCSGTGCSCEPGVCTPGFTCIAGTCAEESSVCRFNSECGDSRVCINGECLAECDDQRACPFTQACDEGVCRDALTSCEAEADCGGGLCRDNVCVNGCSADSECGAERLCIERVCVVDTQPRPFCESDSQCMPGRRCINGTCRTPCNDKDECLRFDVQFGFCINNFCATSNEATSDCSLNTDCDSDKECQDGICR